MDVEHLGRCPYCGRAEREPAFQGVRDGVFGSEGAWDYWACACGILYLDPRPAPDAIGEAYAEYYTHRSSGPNLAWREAGFRGAVRRGYLSGRYGYGFKDASLLGALTWPLRRGAVRNLDFMIRHLPAPGMEGSRILDVGCGNGDFLAVAEDLGHSAMGLDPDPKAVELARSLGFDARCGGMPGSGLDAESFDHVFMSHVLEHLHDPVGALREALSLLAPGGRLWLSLPNIGALGLRRYGRHWRGLEPPRHLTLPGAGRLKGLLAELGFEGVRLLPPEQAALVYYRESQAIASGVDPYVPEAPPGWKKERRAAALANRLSRLMPLRAESLTMVAWRPLTRAEPRRKPGAVRRSG
jgi:SAM-dependent methyltransferase